MCKIIVKTALMALMFPSVVSREEIDKIVSFQPRNNVDSDLNIALDLDAMKYLMSEFTDESFRQAYEVYSKGGYAAPTAQVQLHSSLHFHLDRGAILSAVSKQGHQVKATATQKYIKGETTLQLRYEPGVKCHVGGLAQPEEEGCFDAPGHLTVDGHSDTLYFVESTSFSIRTLRDFSIDSEVNFRPNGDAKLDYYDEFALFEEYYGSPHYADKMIRAAFDKEAHEFTHQVFDFSKSGHKERARFIEKAAAYVSTGMYVMRELNDAHVHCKNDCTTTDCVNHSLHSLDAAVALYTGALQDENGRGSSSNLLFGLANEMCRHFRTCGESGHATFGTAKTNLEIFDEFQVMQTHLTNGQCWAAGQAKDHIIRLMYVPLFQGMIYSAFQKKTGATDYLEEEGAVFAVATLPRFADCSLFKAKHLNHNFAPGDTPNDDFETILSTLQDHYECLDLMCEEIGGIWDYEKGQYHEHAPPCPHTPAASSGSTSSHSTDSQSSGSSHNNNGDESSKSDSSQTSEVEGTVTTLVDNSEPPVQTIVVGVLVAVFVLTALLVVVSRCVRSQHERVQEEHGRRVLAAGLMEAKYEEEFPSSSSRPIFVSPPRDTADTDTVNSTEDLHDISDQIV